MIYHLKSDSYGSVDICPNNTTNDNLFFWQKSQEAFRWTATDSFSPVSNVFFSRNCCSTWESLCFRLDLFFIFVNLVYCFSNMFIAVVLMVGIVFGKYSQKYRSEISSEIIVFLYCMLLKEFTCRNKFNYSFCVALLLVFFQSKINWFYIYKYIRLFIYV